MKRRADDQMALAGAVWRSARDSELALTDALASLKERPASFIRQMKVMSALNDTSRCRPRPQLVSKYGFACVQMHMKALGNQAWDLLESVMLASMDCDVDRAAICLTSLTNRFPFSRRVEFLHAVYHAGTGEIPKALAICDDILDAEPANTKAWKLKIAIMKSCGKWGVAIEQLNALLEIIPSDLSSWRELADMYLRMRQFAYARFALEEVLMLQPGCYSSYLTYAEILVTIGDKRSLDAARQYYAMSIELNPNNNARALYGLLHVLRDSSKTAKKPPIMAELKQLALEKLLDLYRRRAPTLVIFPQEFALRS